MSVAKSFKTDSFHSSRLVSSRLVSSRLVSRGWLDGMQDSGLGKRSWFSSEGGTVVMSSFESMAPTLAKEHWSLHGGTPPDDCHAGGAFGHECTGTNVMSQRNCTSMFSTVCALKILAQDC